MKGLTVRPGVPDGLYFTICDGDDVLACTRTWDDASRIVKALATAESACGWCGHYHDGRCMVDVNNDGNHPGAICGCRGYRYDGPLDAQPWFIGGQSQDGSHVDIRQKDRGTAVCNGVPVRAAGVVIEEHNQEVRRLRQRLTLTTAAYDFVKHREDCKVCQQAGQGGRALCVRGKALWEAAWTTPS